MEKTRIRTRARPTTRCAALTLSATTMAATLAGSAAGALEISGSNGLEGLGSFTGSMTWTYLGSGAGTLALSLTNTSPAANGGRLTGFAFNVVDGVTLTLTSKPNNTWIGMSTVKASPFPDFDFGAALDGNWEGGGAPAPGIGVGSTGNFAFAVSGNDTLLASLSDASFFDVSNGYGFAARFRGFQSSNPDSDKVLADVLVTPLPQTLGLAAASIAGLALFRRRK